MAGRACNGSDELYVVEVHAVWWSCSYSKTRRQNVVCHVNTIHTVELGS